LFGTDRFDLSEFELGVCKILRCVLLILGRWRPGKCAKDSDDFFNGERVWLSRSGQTMPKSIAAGFLPSSRCFRSGATFCVGSVCRNLLSTWVTVLLLAVGLVGLIAAVSARRWNPFRRLRLASPGNYPSGRILLIL